MKVVTTNGTLSRDQPLGPEERPLTAQEAKAHAAECNKRAKQLGIETRYEVKDD